MFGFISRGINRSNNSVVKSLARTNLGAALDRRTAVPYKGYKPSDRNSYPKRKQ